jgi:hypothetical protein
MKPVNAFGFLGLATLSRAQGNFTDACWDIAFTGSTITAICLTEFPSTLGFSHLDLDFCVKNINGNLTVCYIFFFRNELDN